MTLAEEFRLLYAAIAPALSLEHRAQLARLMRGVGRIETALDEIVADAMEDRQARAELLANVVVLADFRARRRGAA